MEGSISLPLTVRDLTDDDLGSCHWAGTPTHLAHVSAALDRARRGDVEYLAICGPPGLPIAIGGIDYAARNMAGTLWQLVVHPALRSCGLGTALVGAAEERIARRGLRRAELGVEESNPRARALYERLGYVAYGSEPDSWTAEGPDGSLTTYETVCTRMRKWLAG